MAKSDTYEEFVEKFKPKLTTDDCYTPEPIYEAIKGWVLEHYGISEDTRIIRPFWNGADYQSYDYSGDCVVIDNPPFSILASICRWYSENGIKFFLFAPSLTQFSAGNDAINYVIASASIVYENGAKVNTNFNTNLGDTFIEVAPDLHDLVDAVVKKEKAEKRVPLPKYIYPAEVCSSAKLNYLAVHGTALKINRHETSFVRSLDSQRKKKKTIFGGGYLLSKRAAAEKAAAEKAAAEKAAAEKAAAEKAAAEKAAAENVATYVWELSERELEIIESLG